MQIFAETERLILREILPTDDQDMFALDSDPEVHRYLGKKPISTIEESRAIIAFIRQQYVDNGIGRWAAVEKQTNQFIGWTGLKLITESINNHINFHDLGYRFIRRYWGKGYATEAAATSREYAFTQLQLPAIYGMTDVNNIASRHVLEKTGLRFVEVFDLLGEPRNWFEMSNPTKSNLLPESF